jgi:hypothetical protein
MSALGQKRTFRVALSMSTLPPKADIRRHVRHVRFGPCVDGSGLPSRPSTLRKPTPKFASFQTSQRGAAVEPAADLIGKMN